MPFDRGCSVETVEGDRSDILRGIRKPLVSLALWHRRLTPCVEDWLKSLSPDELPRGRGLAGKAEFGYAFEEFLADSSTPRGNEASLFVADAVSLLASLTQPNSGKRLVRQLRRESGLYEPLYDQ